MEGTGDWDTVSPGGFVVDIVDWVYSVTINCPIMPAPA